MWTPCLLRRPLGESGVEVRLGHEVVDDYLRFVASRCRPNTVLAAGFDLKVFFDFAGKEPAEVSTADVLEFIARHITENIRVLEGALVRVSAYASLTHEPLTVERATQVLGDVMTQDQPRPITPQLILEETASLFGFSTDEIISKHRQRPLVTARQIAMYVMRELTQLSYPNIARVFGGRDHTTVIHAVDKIGALMSKDRQIYDQVTLLQQRIRQG